MTITVKSRAGYIHNIDVDVEFVGIVGVLSRDKEIRDVAASGSAELSLNDEI